MKLGTSERDEVSQYLQFILGKSRCLGYLPQLLDFGVFFLQQHRKRLSRSFVCCLLKPLDTLVLLLDSSEEGLHGSSAYKDAHILVGVSDSCYEPC
jgi:hypothetical protein